MIKSCQSKTLTCPFQGFYWNKLVWVCQRLFGDKISGPSKGSDSAPPLVFLLNINRVRFCITMTPIEVQPFCYVNFALTPMLKGTRDLLSRRKILIVEKCHHLEPHCLLKTNCLGQRIDRQRRLAALMSFCSQVLNLQSAGYCARFAQNSIVS